MPSLVTPEPEAASTQLFGRARSGENALLLQLDDGRGDVETNLRELAALAGAAGARVLEQDVTRRRRPDPRYYFGHGKVEALRERLVALGGDLVLVNHTLTPAQERNLEAALECRVLDRVGLILDIFAQRAHSHEGKLQVELAQLRHMSSRLVRGWSHLERQKGGIGLRGPGETQLELDRRMIGGRIKQVEKRLARVRGQREQGRQARRKQDLTTVSIVGYTNAGKSTLFNRLAGSDSLVADQLFATLDTTLRRIDLPGAEPAIFADTVGFIRDLPHQLVAAFRSTLEETARSDLLVHVIDAAAADRAERVDEVDATLDAIGAGDIPVLKVYNKIDSLGHSPRVVRDATGGVDAVWLSSLTGEGLVDLLDAIAECVGASRAHGVVELGPGEGRLRSRFYALGEVLAESVTPEGGYRLEVSLPHRELGRLRRHAGLTERQAFALR